MVASLSRTSATAQAGPVLECDWVGNSYSPSMTRTACLMPSSKLPFSRWNSRLAIGALRMWSCSLLWPGKLGFDCDQVLDMHRLGARDVLDRLLVDLHRYRARDARADHARMHHVGQPHVVDHL